VCRGGQREPPCWLQQRSKPTSPHPKQLNPKTPPKKRTGVQPACALFYRATKAYLSRAADYYELRAATRAAAGDLWGANSTQAAAVEAAWDVVGVPRGPYPSPDAPECAAAFATKPSAC
jgi:hypothetical protein